LKNSITWANLKDKVKIAVGKKKMIACYRKKNDEIFQSIFRGGVCALHTLGRHVVTESKVTVTVGCHVVNETLEPKAGN
jgi:hypothetical protein